MTDIEIRKWGCEYVDWYYCEVFDSFGIAQGEDEAGYPDSIEWKSDADLAEEVRKKWIHRKTSMSGGAKAVWICLEWATDGPLKFIQRIMESYSE